MYGARGSRNTGEYGRMAPTQRRGSRVAVGKMEGSGLRLCVGCARTGGASAQKAWMRGEVLRCQTAAASPRGPGGHDRTCKRVVPRRRNGCHALSRCCLAKGLWATSIEIVGARRSAERLLVPYCTGTDFFYRLVAKSGVVIHSRTDTLCTNLGSVHTA